jgi:hypothetical protein
MTDPSDSSQQNTPYQGGTPGYPPPPGNYPGNYPPPPPPPYGTDPYNHDPYSRDPYGAGQYGQYGGAPYGMPPAAPKNGIGVAGLVASVLSLPAVLTVVGGFILGLAGIVLGVIGYRRWPPSSSVWSASCSTPP